MSKHNPTIKEYIPETLNAVHLELDMAAEHHGQFKSSHEGMAIIREEYLELEHEVFHGNPRLAVEEATQLAAMAVKMVTFLLDEMESKP